MPPRSRWPAPPGRWVSWSAADGRRSPPTRRQEGPAVHKGKNYKAAMERFDREHLYTPAEAVELVKEMASAKFDETVELAVRLGVDPRKADQIVRGTLT